MSRAPSESLAGGALGLLVGTLVGLSATPVVASVLTALTAVLATFLGLSESTSSTTTPRRWISAASPIRIVSFSLIAVVGIGMGLYVRTHDALSPGLKTQADAWQSVGFDATRAKEFVAYKTLGLIPAGWTAVQGLAPGSATQDTTKSVLFRVSADDCAQLRPEQYGATELGRAFSLAGERWKAVADAVNDLPAPKKNDALAAVWRLACGRP